MGHGWTRIDVVLILIPWPRRGPNVDGAYFDTLLTIQEVPSTKVHEQSFDGWNANHLKVILASLKEILQEIYVVPAVRSDRRKAILQLKETLVPKAASAPKEPA